MQTRDQKFAAAIYKQVNDVVKEKSKEDRDRYGAMAHKLPVLIRTAGLCQALAFVDARSNDTQKLLLEHMAEVLKVGSKGDLLERSRTAALADYMALTHDAMAALLWYKRFAQSVLGVDAADDAGGAT